MKTSPSLARTLACLLLMCSPIFVCGQTDVETRAALTRFPANKPRKLVPDNINQLEL
jgi:hypothetical protein